MRTPNGLGFASTGELSERTAETLDARTATHTQDQDAADPGAPSVLRRGATLGRYVVLDFLGGGGMGMVYTAYDPELDRKVALKLLKAGSHDSGGSTRLLREAQALARLAHPNVVAVHDVGAVGGQLFVAMEFVQGATLDQALAARSYAWPAVLELLVAVGRGLAAAHRAGLVHRDLKPQNIMVDGDGRARVMDFGLARVEPDEFVAADDTLIKPRELALERAITQAGAVLGTPLYMAPEQWTGQTADARSDQFALCVVAWEALFGARPFHGQTYRALHDAVLRGEIAEPRPTSGAPGWLRDVLRRGLATDPARRFPDIDALLAALAPRRRAGWTRPGLALLGAAGLAVAALAQVRLSQEPAATPCVGLAARLAGVWDEPRRAAGESAFHATGKPHAASAWAQVSDAIDAYSAAWVAEAQDACMATRVHGVQSEDLLDRRTACLERRQGELRGLVDLLVRADAEIVANAAGAVERLTPLTSCGDTTALLSALPPPPIEVAAQVAALRGRLDSAKPLVDAVALREAEAVLRPLVAEADELRYPPVRAEVRRLLADTLRRSGGAAEAERLLHEALAAAESVGDGEQATQARFALVEVLRGASRLDEALLMARLVEHELDRPGREAARADLAAVSGRLFTDRGDLAAARAALKDALARQVQLHGPDSLPVARVLEFQSYISLLGGRLTEARTEVDRSLAVFEAHFGPNHPQLLRPLIARGEVLRNQAAWTEAMAAYERSLALVLAALGPDHREVGHCRWAMGDLEWDRQNYAAATEHYEAALANTERAMGPDHPATAECLARLAGARALAGRRDEALRMRDRVLEIHGRNSGPDSYLTLRARRDRAALLGSSGRHDEALAELVAVAAATERTQGDSGELATTLALLGDAALAAGRAAAAIDPLQRALTLEERDPAVTGTRAHLSMQLAEATWASGGDRDQARRYAEAAAALWKTLGDDFAADQARAAAWLADPRHRRR